jgi:hypothetical protein
MDPQFNGKIDKRLRQKFHLKNDINTSTSKDTEQFKLLHTINGKLIVLYIH